MSDLLAEMARRSAERAQAAPSEADLRARIADLPPPPVLDTTRFGIIAEVKRRAPSTGVLAGTSLDPVEQARAYAAGGAAAISVLTEPHHFAGSLEDLSRVAAAVPVPAMRKDFLVDPIQVLEARAAGAGGVLLIVRMLSDGRLRELISAAEAVGLFALVEAFDREDLARVPSSAGLVGLNCRDLRTLGVEPMRFETHRGAFPDGCVAVAESGMATAEDTAWVRGLGYGMALVGTALMRSADPAALVAGMRG